MQWMARALVARDRPNDPLVAIDRPKDGGMKMMKASMVVRTSLAAPWVQELAIATSVASMLVHHHQHIQGT